MTLVLAGMCWVKRGFWSSEDVNSCWLDESDLLAVAAVRSKRWNQPSAPTATTKFCQTEQKKKNTLYHQNFPDSLLQIIKHFITHPSFVADVSDCDAGQLGKQQIVRWVRETISLWNHECFQVSVLTMPTQVLVIQGLESSFLYTCSFPLVSPTTSSFNCS